MENNIKSWATIFYTIIILVFISLGIFFIIEVKQFPNKCIKTCESLGLEYYTSTSIVGDCYCLKDNLPYEIPIRKEQPENEEQYDGIKVKLGGGNMNEVKELCIFLMVIVLFQFIEIIFNTHYLLLIIGILMFVAVLVGFKLKRPLWFKMACLVMSIMYIIMYIYMFIY